MVPSQLMTVVSPSSWYGFPLCPSPVTVAVLFFGLAPVAPRFNEDNLRGARIDPANTPTLPRKLRRFHFELSRIAPAPFSFYLAATAAMQLISTSESPGKAATATVVRAGPP